MQFSDIGRRGVGEKSAVAGKMFITGRSQQIEKGSYHKHVAIHCVFFNLSQMLSIQSNIFVLEAEKKQDAKQLRGVSVVMRVVCSGGACTHHRVST